MPLKDDIRHLWVPPDYQSNFGSAAVVLPPAVDFLRVYYLTSAEHAVSNIALGRIKVARFADLNDPFELLSVNFRESRVRTFIREAGEIVNSCTGLICFSADWTSPVLWSHYASKHHGVCLGFDLRKALAERVSYESERILADISEDGDPHSLDPDFQRLLVCTKYREWSYEQEVRTFVRLEDMAAEGNLYFRAFDQDLNLKEVILGPRCTLHLGSVRSLISELHPEARAFRATLAYKFFKVVPSPSTVDW